MDLMRESMGFKKIGYLGFSYGTYLGGVYATLFPNNVEAMVLDSAFDPAGDTPEESALTQAVGFNETYNRFGAWCEDNDKCPFTTTDFNADWLALEKQLDNNSIVTKSGRFVNHEVLDTATISAFYSESTWPVLAKALQDARNGKGAGLLALADDYNGRDKKGRYATSSDSKPVIDCASGIVNKGSKDPAKMLKTVKEKAPWFYRDAQESWFKEGDYCGKPFADAKLISLNYSGAAPMVVIGGDKDPATPYRWAEKMSKNLKGSVLVKYTGEGHSSVGSNVCTSKVARKVFVDKELPPAGKECGVDVPLAEPTWWDSATRGISGTALSKEVLDSLFGINSAEMFLEYRTFAGDPNDAFAQLSKGLQRNGFSYFEAGESDPTMGPQYFGSKEGILRAVFLSAEMLMEDGLTSELTDLPIGSTLVILIFDLPMD
jgi:pimeloyl-ACP methyl ester carboxylesterase